MFIATLVILAVFGLIFLSVIWLTPTEKTGILGETIKFEDFLNRKLVGESFNGTWFSGEHIPCFLSMYDFNHLKLNVIAIFDILELGSHLLCLPLPILTNSFLFLPR